VVLAPFTAPASSTSYRNFAEGTELGALSATAYPLTWPFRSSSGLYVMSFRSV
jgi:hypothetical protein